MNTTECLNGELRPGDLVISTPDDEYACLVGTVLVINKAGSPEHDAETDNPGDDVHVNFMDSDYSERRVREIEAMFSELYGDTKRFGECPIDDAIMAPDTLIRITGIGRDELSVILESEADAAAFCKSVTDGLTSLSFTPSKDDRLLTHAEKALDEPDAGEDARTAALRERLMERLDDNFHSYIDYLRDLEDTEIIDSPLEISARTGTYFYLTTIHNFHASELEYLLKFENPLRVVADEFEWDAATDNRSDIMWKVFHEQEAFKNGKHTLEPEPPKGWLIGTTDDSDGFYIPNAAHIQRDDSLFIYPDDDAAARAAEKDGVRLIYGMPFVPDGVYLDTPENRDIIAAHFEQHRLSLPAEVELVQALGDRLDDNFAGYKDEMLRLEKTHIFNDAAEIAAVQQAYGYFRDEHHYTTGQAEFLLKLENPLELMSDRWGDGIGSVRDVVKAVFDDQERTLRGGSYTLLSDDPAPDAARTAVKTGEKPSVMEQIRQAAKEARERPTIPKDSQARNKSGPDL